MAKDVFINIPKGIDNCTKWTFNQLTSKNMERFKMSWRIIEAMFLLGNGQSPLSLLGEVKEVKVGNRAIEVVLGLEVKYIKTVLDRAIGKESYRIIDGIIFCPERSKVKLAIEAIKKVTGLDVGLLDRDAASAVVREHGEALDKKRIKMFMTQDSSVKTSDHNLLYDFLNCGIVIGRERKVAFLTVGSSSGWVSEERSGSVPPSKKEEEQKQLVEYKPKTSQPVSLDEIMKGLIILTKKIG
jgi:hypothetical protein